jgi:hypothetical protein
MVALWQLIGQQSEYLLLFCVGSKINFGTGFRGRSRNWLGGPQLTQTTPPALSLYHRARPSET